MKRADAAKLGITKYSTGKPCLHGHISDRYTVSGICCVCSNIATAKNNKRVRADVMRLRTKSLLGKKEVTVLVPEQDVETLNAFAMALNMEHDAKRVLDVSNIFGSV